MARNLRKSVADISKQKRIKAIVVEYVNHLVSVRLSGSTRLLKGLTLVGGPVTRGQLVYVDYSSGTPVVQAGNSPVSTARTVISTTRFGNMGSSSASAGDAQTIRGIPVIDAVPNDGDTFIFDAATAEYILGPGGSGGGGGPGATGATGPTGPLGPSGPSGGTGARGYTGATGVGATGPTGPEGPGGSGHVIDWEYTPMYSRPNLNFKGTGVVVNDGATGAGGTTDVTITDSLPHEIYYGGEVLTQRPRLAFTRAGVAVNDAATGPGGTSIVTVSSYGATGPQGPTGPTGAGVTGASGPTGPQGDIGASGPTGPSGASGPMGPTGPSQGPPGATGASGPSGSLGIDGVTGATGPAGSPGGSDWIHNIDGRLYAQTDIAAFVGVRNTTILKVYLYGLVLGSAGNTIVDVHKNGTTIFTTQGNRPTLPYNDADHVIYSAAPEVSTLVAGDLITIDLDAVAVGSSGLAVVIQIDSAGIGPTGPTGPSGGPVGPTGPVGPAVDIMQILLFL